MTPDLLPLPTYRTMEAEAERWGFASARALRDFCKRYEVPYLREGKRNWVRPVDLEAAFQRLSASPPPPEESDDAWLEAAVSRAKSRGRKP